MLTFTMKNFKVSQLPLNLHIIKILIVRCYYTYLNKRELYCAVGHLNSHKSICASCSVLLVLLKSLLHIYLPSISKWIQLESYFR